MSAGAVPFPKLNFTGGEIGEEVSARPDLEIFQSSFESGLNLVPQPFGGIRRRAGAGFIDYTHPLLASDAGEWIIPFRYSDTQSYIILFYDGFMRFYTDAALILDSSFVPPAAITNLNWPGGIEVALTVNGHGFLVGELYIINGSIQTELNGREFDVISTPSGNVFRIQDVDVNGRTFGADAGTLTKAFSITHPYAVADLPFLRYSQTGDTLVITHPDYPPKKLVRGAAHDDWTLSDAAFESTQIRPSVESVAVTTPSAATPPGGFNVQYAVTRVGFDGSEGLPTITDAHKYLLAPLGFEDKVNNVTLSAESVYRVLGGPAASTDTVEVDIVFTSAFNGYVEDNYNLLAPGEWNSQDVVVEFSESGLFDQDMYDQTAPYVVLLLGLGTPLVPPVGLQERYPFIITEAMSPVPAAPTRMYATKLLFPGAAVQNYIVSFYRDVASWRVYRRGDVVHGVQAEPEDELWGLLADIPSKVPHDTERISVRKPRDTYVDYAQQSIDYSNNPPSHREVFHETDEYPVASEFHEQRLIMGGSNNDPRIVNTSKSAAPFDFNLGHFVQADGALKFPIIGRTGQAIQHLVSAKELIVFTDGGEWMVNTPGQPLLPDTLAPKEHSTWGCSQVRPITVGNSIVFVQFGGHKVREMRYQLQSDLFVSDELSILARHLFKDNPIIDMAYVEEPTGILWALLEDGNLASMTYVQERGIWAWAHHDFGGTVKSIASIREENETDFLYLLIMRTVSGEPRVYLERMEENYNTTKTFGLAAHLDSSLAYNPADNILSRVDAIADNGDGTFDFELSVAHTLTVNEFFYLYGADVTDVDNPSDLGVPEGLYQAGPTISGAPNRTLIIPVQWLGDVNFSPVAGPCKGQIREVVTELSGLFHMGNEEVCVWGDEGIEETLTVSAATGKVTLTTPLSRAVAGEANEWRLKLLKLDDPSGVARSKIKRTSDVFGNFLASQRPQIADGDGDEVSWSDWPKRGVADGATLYGPKSGTISTKMPSSYDEDSGQIVLSGTGGGPLYLLSLTPEALIGD